MGIDEVLQSLANVSASLVRDTDLTGVLATGLDEAVRAVEADAAGILVTSPPWDLEVLAATTHRANDLEAFQASGREGPCVDCLTEQAAIDVPNLDHAAERWPDFATQMRASGYVRALALPMRWQGTAIGGLNLFWTFVNPTSSGSDAGNTLRVAQTFADILAVAIVSVHPTISDLTLSRVQDALTGRALIEQAKGVLAQERDVDMDTAFEAVLALSRERNEPLGAVARFVIDQARRGTLPDR